MATEIPETSSSSERARIIERPDGFYWRQDENGEEFGPFDTLAETIRDMECADENIEPEESLAEVERETGIADWIDEETVDREYGRDA